MKLHRSIIVRGIETSIRTDRRYAVVAVRQDAHETAGGWLIAFARIENTTSHIDRARQLVRQLSANTAKGIGVEYVVVDFGTGQEV